jgi:hypothetical protein
MLNSIRAIATAIALLTLSIGTAQAHGASPPGHGHWHHHPHWGLGIGIGFGFGVWPDGYYYRDPWYPGYVIVQAQPPAALSAPDPVIVPRNGQSAAQAEADRQQCNRWATTQPAAMADAGEFQRATLACMEGRGYSIR